MSQGRLNISWDPLPCHLQNGADISGYIIRYTQLSTGEASQISYLHTSFLCGQESDGPYTCRVAYTFFRSQNQTYAFQVAAQNIEGVGSFSDPITKFISSTMSIFQGIDPSLLLILLYNLFNMFSDNTTACTTHIQVVTEITDSYLGNTREATSTPPNYGSSTVTVASFDSEPESIPISTSQGTDSIIMTTAVTAGTAHYLICTIIIIMFSYNNACRICIVFR